MCILGSHLCGTVVVRDIKDRNLYRSFGKENKNETGINKKYSAGEIIPSNSKL